VDTGCRARQLASMYLQSFGLTKNPFALTADTSMLFLSEAHREALAGLRYGILYRKGLLLLSGQPGTGKTMLLTRSAEALPPNRIQFATIPNPTLTPPELLEAVLLTLRIPAIPSSKPQRLALLEKALFKIHDEDKIFALAVDEADKLTPELLEEIRLLGNLERGGEKLLQVLLIGQEALEPMLNRADLVQLKQRVAVRLALRPLDRNEVYQYIEHRWRSAGGASEAPFSAAALEAVIRHSEGIPRLVNIICDNSLLAAFGERCNVVEAFHVIQSCADLDLLDKHAEPASRSEPVTGDSERRGIPSEAFSEDTKPSAWAKWKARLLGQKLAVGPYCSAILDPSFAARDGELPH
jgi:general secretion pathway protein A